MKKIRLFLWALVALTACFAGYLTIMTATGNRIPTPAALHLGAPFELVRHDGRPITEKAFEGRAYALFFGFTFCPDVCPTTLAEASSWMKELGPDGDKVDFYFVTVDPERDSPEALARYISSFDPRITGITGDPLKIGKLLDSYKIYAEKVNLDDGDYTMDHTASVLLFRADGSLQGTVGYGEAQETAVAKLQILVGS